MPNNTASTADTEDEYSAALDRCEQALTDYQTGVDELGESYDAVGKDSIENAIHVIDSAADELLAATAALIKARATLDFDQDDDLVGLKIDTLRRNKERVEETAAEITSLLKETPSDGEQLEEQLEKLIEAATTLYESLEDIL